MKYMFTLTVPNRSQRLARYPLLDLLYLLRSNHLNHSHNDKQHHKKSQHDFGWTTIRMPILADEFITNKSYKDEEKYDSHDLPKSSHGANICLTPKNNCDLIYFTCFLPYLYQP